MKLNEKSKQIIFEIVPIILFALALVIRFAVDIERLQWGLMEVAAILWLVDNLEKYKKEHTKIKLTGCNCMYSASDCWNDFVYCRLE